MTESELYRLAEELGVSLRARGLKVVTAESCTAGLVAAALTEVSGSSQWFDRGFITYSDQAKHEMLGVRFETLRAAGAVSEETALEMARGARERSLAQLAVAVTGIAGPTGGTPEKPVGLVCFAWDTHGLNERASRYFFGDRQAIRMQATQEALVGLLRLSLRAVR